ncbi:MAG: carboxypeptidase-like regulatory domain-containing protein, partial [Candidatus Marinimicrobia bacterium]|nr:carboxypeptidase-like regulatory domain-containing protein [Candidatus Neomarinimicrobiota bacterium]MBT4270696.1 carboxypeptidase-like regulatory domain-containing protein [Candidatus Neomarinimicrobiota bacterium]MBT4371611.1 carboxypeptidase-like regulatory domain-containing protein [Candidatus Neomarinimicrobiota bacterium]MBT6129454.1 carboxypeptidase-like regulatory domain-containing protein [Candidatus Neomarinimicrobiota bacterium]MBT7738599.1 carboxypeptidase-like regulatory domain-
MQFRILSILLCLGSTLLLGQSIHGFVREDANGEPLFYVNVFIKDSYKGAATNQDGYYVIPNVPPGDYEVIASIIGYQMKTQKMVLGEGEDIRLDFRLDVAVIAGEEVNVSAERIKFQKMVEPSRVTLDMREINAAPAFIEADLFRT